jgi:hypothetical protein
MSRTPTAVAQRRIQARAAGDGCLLCAVTPSARLGVHFPPSPPALGPPPVPPPLVAARCLAAQRVLFLAGWPTCCKLNRLWNTPNSNSPSPLLSPPLPHRPARLPVLHRPCLQSELRDWLQHAPEGCRLVQYEDLSQWIIEMQGPESPCPPQLYAGACWLGCLCGGQAEGALTHVIRYHLTGCTITQQLSSLAA